MSSSAKSAPAPRILVITGDGKGKTTAALGMLLRAVGHGMRVFVVQFVKSDATTGEIRAARTLPGVEWRQIGEGFIPKSTSPEFARHADAAADGLAIARDAIVGGRYDLVILDEICVAVAAKLLDIDAVEDVLHLAKPATAVVLTGRNAPSRLQQLADTVSDIRCVKHAFHDGVPAQAGVEF